MKYWKREMRKVKIRQEEEGASSKEGFVLGGEIIRQSQCIIIFFLEALHTAKRSGSTPITTYSVLLVLDSALAQVGRDFQAYGRNRKTGEAQSAADSGSRRRQATALIEGHEL